MATYTTIQGDTYDAIAKRVYGRESLMVRIMQANPQFLGVAVFSAGETLTIPDVADEQLTAPTVPPWREDA